MDVRHIRDRAGGSMVRFLSAVAVTTFVFAASAANAATYYVATNGSDTANGSATTPFKTVRHAARIVKPGDIVNVRGGVYYDKVSIYAKGTSTARIVFRAMAGERPILDGTNLPAATPVVFLSGTEYVDFSGFEIRNSSYMGISALAVRQTRILNNVIHHMAKNGIYVGGDTMPANYDVTVQGNRVYNTVLENQYHTMNGGWSAAVVVSRTQRATITYNRIYDNDGEGLISLRSTYATIRGNVIYDNFSASLYLDNARFVTADRNLIYATANTRYYRDGKPGIGIGVANEYKDVQNPSSDNVFTNNIVVGTRWGFYYGNFEFGGGLRNTKVINNTFYGTVDEIIRIENGTHANSVVANNIFFQTTSPAPKYSGSGPVSYRKNLWYGGPAGAAAGTGDLFGNPMFVNAGGRTSNDYKLQSGSPALFVGLGMTEVKTDFFGKVRTASFDVGAHEFSLNN
jgi:hypothetical protein